VSKDKKRPKKARAKSTAAVVRDIREEAHLVESHLRALRHYLDPAWVDCRVAEHEAVIAREQERVRYHRELQAGAPKRVAQLEAELADIRGRREAAWTNPLVRKLVRIRAEVKRLEKELAEG